MNTLLLALPFLLLQLFNGQNVKGTIISMLKTVPLCSLFILLPPIAFYPFIFTFVLANTVHQRTFNYPLSFSSLRNIKNLPSLRDSINKQIPFILLIPLIIGVVFYSFLLKPAFICTLFFTPISVLYYKRNKDSKEKVDFPEPENEIFTKSHKDYPLEKYTAGFKGEQLVKLHTKDKPHVVFLYLESFKVSEIGKSAPYFSKLIKEGIYFNNFYANATQTFKAMFATLYGLPPCFGADFTSSSSPVLTLPLFGLPDLFKDRGYTNVFMKAGSMHFEKQGEFLQNHGFDEISDAKDIKTRNEKAFGTSWGVHDEFLYDYLAERISSAKEPLFISAASVTNHHPFILPHHFKAKHGSTPFEKTTEYTDWALYQAIERLKSLNIPMHVYIMGDHGYPDGHKDKPSLSPTLGKDVSHVPFLILPLNDSSFIPRTIDTISSQIDLLPTLMDIYGFYGTNSSIGSSLCRKRSEPTAYLLNEALTPISGKVTKDSYETSSGYSPLYNSLYSLYKEKKISSSGNEIKSLDFSGQNLSPKSLSAILEKNTSVENIYLNDVPTIATLDLPFPDTLKKITLDNNILITDEDIKYLPKNLESISIAGCMNLRDQTLTYLVQMSISEITLSSGNFSNLALSNFFSKVRLKKLYIKDGFTTCPSVLEPLSTHPLEEICLESFPSFTNDTLRLLCKKDLKLFMCNDGSSLTDEALQYLKATSLQVLHIENGKHITDNGINHLLSLPVHTFFLSRSEHITSSSIEQLNTPFMQNLFCINCNKIADIVQQVS